MSIADNIRHLRESHELTQKQFAAIAGVSDKAVSTWEKGKKTPRMTAVNRICTYFDIPKSALLDDHALSDDLFTRTFDRFCAATGQSPQIAAREMGIPRERFAMLRQGSAFPLDDEVSRFNHYFGISSLTDSGERGNVLPITCPPPAYRIPVLGRVPAGIPVEAVTDVVDHIVLDTRVAQDGYDYFALLVTGDSMYPEYHDGDVVIVRVQSTAETGDDVVAYVDGSDATLKRLMLTATGLQLRPLNPAYPVRSFTHQQAAEQKVTIAGVVVEQRRMRRR